jgi:hypothetical protein
MYNVKPEESTRKKRYTLHVMRDMYRRKERCQRHEANSLLHVSMFLLSRPLPAETYLAEGMPSSDNVH